MEESYKQGLFNFYKLNWDTEFFGVNCAKAVLYEPLSLNEWIQLKESFNKYQFISIENRNSESSNAKLIGEQTSAFLIDVNIQFQKKSIEPIQRPEDISFHQALDRNDEIINLADFSFSKFTEDPELARRGGDQVYRQWLINSFSKDNKYFVISKNEQDRIDGFLLYSYTEDACVIELIAVSKTTIKGGIGSKLFKAIEYKTQQKGYKQIRVGTQVRNASAINFYQKNECKQVGCHQIYHLWNL